MKIVVITREALDSREPAVLASLFAAGLERCHVRKPEVSRDELADWLRLVPSEFRSRLVLHQFHGLVSELRLGGRHWRDEPASALVPQVQMQNAGRSFVDSGFTSRSCHDCDTLRAALGGYDSVFFGPLFPSLSKPGHGPREDFDPGEITSLLSHRSAAERRTAVIALGGVTLENAPRCREVGFDGVAVLGTIWNAADPVLIFNQLQTAIDRYAA